MNRNQAAVAAAFFAIACASLPAQAALGGRVESVRDDAVAMNSRLAARATIQSAYTVQRLSLNNGTTIDEYASAAGIVFALHWEGPRPPDLRQLLGGYYAEFQAASSVPRLRQARTWVDATRMHYRSGGHMGALWGTAYAPALLPADLKMEDLR